MTRYNGIEEDDYAILLHKEYLVQKDAENAYEDSMINKRLVKKKMSCEEQLREQASYYENNCFNTFKR